MNPRDIGGTLICLGIMLIGPYFFLGSIIAPFAIATDILTPRTLEEVEANPVIPIFGGLWQLDAYTHRMQVTTKGLMIVGIISLICVGLGAITILIHETSKKLGVVC